MQVTINLNDSEITQIVEDYCSEVLGLEGFRMKRSYVSLGDYVLTNELEVEENIEEIQNEDNR